MRPKLLAVALVVAGLSGAAGGAPAGRRADAGRTTGLVAHDYVMSARIRPLLLFWITRRDVGRATVTWRTGAGQHGYSLLIGSDPDRAHGINRWGYLDEQIHGPDASLIGLMTVSGEQSIQEVEARLKSGVDGHAFKVIRGSIEGDRAEAVVTTLDTPEDYSFRQLNDVLALLPPASTQDRSRTLDLPAGTQPGFLSALADLVHETVQRRGDPAGVARDAPIRYFYYGRMYELRAARVRPVSALRVGETRYRDLLEAEFENLNLSSGEITRFGMTYGTTGQLREIPVTMTYQPRWWLRVDLALADDGGAPGAELTR